VWRVARFLQPPALFYFIFATIGAMRFAEALARGLVPEFGMPDKTITTLLSTLCLFGEKVIKVYKHEYFFFTDLADFDSRKEFYFEDFFWNNLMAPEIYLSLRGVTHAGGAYTVVDPEDGEDFFIEMSKIDDSTILTKTLLRGLVSVDQIEHMTRTLVHKLRLLTIERKEKLKSQFSQTLQDIQRRYIEDLRAWAILADPYVDTQETDKILDLVTKAVEKEEYFKSGSESKLSVVIDTNSDNLLFVEGKPSFIDIMPPKQDWKVTDEYFPISRLAMDAYVLGSTELGDAVHRVYSTFRPAPPPMVRLIYDIETALIQWPYRHMLDDHETAERYKQFLLPTVEELKALL